MKVLSTIAPAEPLYKTFQEKFPTIDLTVSNGTVDSENAFDYEIVLGNVAPEILVKAKNLKWVQLLSSGIDEYMTLDDTPIIVTTARGLHWKPIAEYLIFALLYFARKHDIFQSKKMKREWFRQPATISLLESQRIGLVGFGGVAKTLVEYLRPFNADIVAVSRYAQEKAMDGVKMLSWNEWDALLQNSDHIILSLPLTKDTQGLMDRNTISRLKAGSYIYNASRGALIDEDALIEALQSGHVAGAALDVFTQEPLPTESPLWTMDNVLLTPHLAGHHAKLRENIFNLFIENMTNFINGEELVNRADFKRGY